MRSADGPIDAPCPAVDLRRVSAFVAAAEELHFGRAARRIRVSQPTLSQHVKTLETEWGVSLFVRASRGVRLSEPGQRILPAARRLIRTATAMRQEVAAVAAGSGGTVRIGYVDEAFSTVMPTLLGAVRDGTPDLRCSTSRLRGPLHAGQALSEGACDMVVTDPRHLGLGVTRLPLADVPYVAALPAGHALAVGDRLTLASVHRDPDLLHSAVEPRATADERRRAPEPADGPHEVILAVATGRGPAVVTETARSTMPVDGVIYRDLDDAPAMPLVLAWSGTNPNPALDAVARTVRSVTGRRSPA
ncbi:MAG: LysR family transcriptional regulator [Solirubrobacteraceae bacterium]